MNDMRERLMAILEEADEECIGVAATADALIESGLLFDPKTDIRPRFKIGTTIFRTYNTRGCNNCTKKYLVCDGISCPKPTMNAMKYQLEDIGAQHERDIYATEAEARAELEGKK